MSNKKNLIIIYVFILLELLILINSKEVTINIIKSITIFKNRVFPSLFPAMIIGSLLIKNNIQNFIPNIINIFFKKIFNFDRNMTSLFIISIFSGTPSNALFINEYLNKGLINDKTAENLLCCTHFINPLFVINGVGIGIFNSVQIGFILLFFLYLSNFIKAFILRKKFTTTNTFNKKISKSNFINDFQNTIKESILACLNILGIIIIFNILIILLENIFSLSISLKLGLNILLEMTSSTILLSFLNINFYLKFIISYFILTFGGLCIQMQTLNMLQNKKIRYFKYLIFRML